MSSRLSNPPIDAVAVASASRASSSSRISSSPSTAVARTSWAAIGAGHRPRRPVLRVERGDRLFLKDLARLVEDHDVEMTLAPVQQLTDRQRARDPTGCDPREDVGARAKSSRSGMCRDFLRRLGADQIRLVEVLVHRLDGTLAMEPAHALGGRRTRSRSNRVNSAMICSCVRPLNEARLGSDASTCSNAE